MNSFNRILLMVHHMIGTEHVEEWAVPALVSDRYREHLNDMSEDEEDLEADGSRGGVLPFSQHYPISVWLQPWSDE